MVQKIILQTPNSTFGLPLQDVMLERAWGRKARVGVEFCVKKLSAGKGRFLNQQITCHK
jgi:hypothetical protein